MYIQDIKTERFYLSILKPEQISNTYLQWFNDQIVQQQIASKPKTLEQLAVFVDDCLKAEHLLLFGIFTQAEQLHIGNLKYHFLDQQKSMVDLGILIGDISWRGKAVAQEVIDASSKQLKHRFSTSLLTLGVKKQNIAAVKAYTKMGFIKEPRDLSAVDRTISYLMSKPID